MDHRRVSARECGAGHATARPEGEAVQNALTRLLFCAALRMALRDTGVSPGLPGENDSMSMRGGQLGFQGLAVPQDTAKLIGPSGFGLTRSPRRQSPTRGRTVGDGAGCQASISGAPSWSGSADASLAWKLVGQARRPPDCRSWAEVTELRRRRGPGGPPAACGA